MKYQMNKEIREIYQQINNIQVELVQLGKKFLMVPTISQQLEEIASKLNDIEAKVGMQPK